mmetsp:Transcript_1473/g.5402  ORF Transcript_1473/g.5402 Transcript_1473/m.5402 type:complete len:224 (+) Transcript_1473:36-707(+)
MSTTTTTTTCSRAAAAAFHRPTLIKNFAPTKAAPAARAALKKRAQLRGIGLVAQSELDDGGNSSLGKATTSAAEVGDDSDVNDDEKSSNQRGASLSSRERLRQALNEEIDGAMREVSRAQTEEERRPAAAAAAAVAGVAVAVAVDAFVVAGRVPFFAVLVAAFCHHLDHRHQIYPFYFAVVAVFVAAAAVVAVIAAELLCRHAHLVDLSPLAQPFLCRLQKAH